METQELIAEPNSNARKSFFPLESDPELFTTLAHDLGLSSSLGFYDVFSVNEPELLALIPRPVHALVLCFTEDGEYAKWKEGVEAEEAKAVEHWGISWKV